ncbi:MAG TPA: alpha/beta hydrolase [Geothrix sp.]|nr:alpha/beta hydrolase [Geothrix sp.]
MIEHPPGQFIEVRGKRLWVEREGRGEPLILLTGGPADSHFLMHPAFSPLADRFELIYVDYAGRGRSEKPVGGDVTFEGDVADLEGLRAALGFERWNVYGFSYGGLLAQAHALAHPERVARLVLANTLHSPEMWQLNHANIAREIEFQFPEMWERILELKAAGVPSSDPRMRASFAVHRPLIRFFDASKAAPPDLSAEVNPRDIDLYFRFCGADIDWIIGGEVARLPDFRPRLKELAMPTLIVAGRYDRALYPKLQMDFKRCAPQARFVMLERSGSFAHVEEPETLLPLLRDFLTS